MNRSIVSVVLLALSAPSFAQDGIQIDRQDYYHETVKVRQPFLRGQLPISERITSLGRPIQSGDCGSCCTPLLPTVAQGIRDTFNLLFPCHGLRGQTGQGLLFSARFYESGCCGSSIGGGEVIIESGNEPTPARAVPMPEEVIPEELGNAIQFRRLPATTSVRGTSKGISPVRQISGQFIIPTDSRTNTRSYPSNPLRR